MRGVLVAWSFALLAATGSTATAQVQEELDVPGQDATDLRGDALVWEDARFYLEPWEGSTSIQFSSLSRSRRDDVGRAMPVRIVDASLRSFVEIEFPNRSDCTFRRLEVDPRLAGLRTYVRRTDLAPVLVRPYAVTYGNGTSVKLGVGLPLVPTATGHYLISARGDKLRLPIPHAYVGYAYAHKPVADEILKPPVVRIDRTHTPRIDDVAFEVRQYWIAPKPTRTSGEHSLLRFSTRCVDLVVSVPTTSVRPAEVPPPYPRRYSPAPSSRPQGWRVPVGAPLQTPEKREVAVAAAMIDVGPPDGDLACFDARLSMWPTDERAYHSPVHRMFRLCAAKDLVENQPVETTQIGSPDDLPPPPDVAKPPPGAHKTPKGVHYRFLSPRKSGPRPKPTSTVRVHYTGWTADGRMFDSTVRRGTPATFPLTGVIAGWTDGLQVMAVGERVRFWIPAHLAYKNQPSMPQGMLVFDVDLLAIQ